MRCQPSVPLLSAHSSDLMEAPGVVETGASCSGVSSVLQSRCCYCRTTCRTDSWSAAPGYVPYLLRPILDTSHTLYVPYLIRPILVTSPTCYVPYLLRPILVTSHVLIILVTSHTCYVPYLLRPILVTSHTCYVPYSLRPIRIFNAFIFKLRPSCGPHQQITGHPFLNFFLYINPLRSIVITMTHVTHGGAPACRTPGREGGWLTGASSAEGKGLHLQVFHKLSIINT